MQNRNWQSTLPHHQRARKSFLMTRLGSANGWRPRQSKELYRLLAREVTIHRGLPAGEALCSWWSRRSICRTPFLALEGEGSPRFSTRTSWTPAWSVRNFSDSTSERTPRDQVEARVSLVHYNRRISKSPTTPARESLGRSIETRRGRRFNDTLSYPLAGGGPIGGRITVNRARSRSLLPALLVAFRLSRVCRSLRPDYRSLTRSLADV